MANPPAIFTAKIYDTEVTIKIPNSDLSIDEVLDVFKKITLANGFSCSAWKDAIIQLALVYESELDSDHTDDTNNPDYVSTKDVAP